MDARRHQVFLATISALVAMTAAATLMLGETTRTSPNAVSEAVARALGPHVRTATERDTRTRGVRISIERHGFAYNAGTDGTLRIATVGVGGHALTSNYAHGVQRRTWFGDESVAVTGDKAEIYLTVRKQLHRHTWSWRLDTPLEARVSDSGWVGFFDRQTNKLMSVSMPPVQIFDARGHDITPDGLTWGLRTTKGQQYLTLTLDDSKLALPYTIDPAAYRTNATASSVAATGTFTVTIPATVNAKDLLLVHESGKATTPTATFPTTPTDNTGVGANTWAQVAGTNVAAGSIDQFVWWKWAVAADASKTVTATIPASTLPTVTTAVVDVYKGLDSTQAGPQDTGQTNNVTGHRWFTPPAITATGATAQEHMFLLASGVFASSAATWPASLVAGGTWTLQSSGSSGGSATTQSMAAYDNDTAANTAFTATQSGNIFGANTDSVTSAFGFTDDITAPTNSVSITNLTGNAYLGTATGSTATLYYKGSAAGNFQLSNAVTDAGSGPASSTFPALGGTTTSWSHTAPGTITTPTGGPYASGVSPNNFSWLAGASSSPTEAIVGTDNGGNTATTTLTFTNDITATAPTFTFPSSGSVYNAGGWTTIAGSASDAGSGVASNQVSIQDTTVGGSSCWNAGTSTFTAACPNYITATGTTSWTYAGIASGNLTNGHAYTVTARTVDNVANTSATTTSSFTYDSSAPATTSLTTNGTYNGAGFPANLTGTATDSGTGGNGISAVNLSIKDSTSNKCWNGANFTTAACPNWIAVTSGGTASGSANANWSYSSAGMGAQLTDGDTYTVQIQATDATTNGNQSGTLTAGTFKYDASAPTASITNPSNNGAYNSAGWPGINGSAADTTAGVATVKVSIQKDGGATSCWDGTNAAGHFTAACPNYVTATGTTAWSVTLGTAALVSGSSYALTVQTTDSATNANTNNSAASATFTYDTSAPSNASLTTNATYNSAGWPGSVQGTTNDSGAGSNGISAVSVSIQKDGGASACWNGTSFGSACPNWVAVTSGNTATGANNASWSYTLASSALTNGSTYAVSVRATDATTSGNQSGALSTSSFTYDTSAPSSAALTTNGNYNSGGWGGSVQGTVSDSGSGSHGISAVDVSILDSASGKCWNGANFTTAACPNWVAVTSGNTATGANNASWSYTLAAGALTDGHTYSVSVRATDATTNGNQSGTLAAGSFTYDSSAPSSAALTTNGNYNSAGWPGSVQGTVSDSGTGSHGISAVDVSIQDSVSGKCWNGTNFTTAACPNWVAVTSGNTATGANNASWSYTLASSALTDGHSYTVAVRATDATTNGNQSGTLSTSSFTYDTSAPSSASLTTNGSYNSAGWPGSVQGTVSDSGTGSHGISAVSVSIQKDAGASACWNGATFTAACPNWVAVTSGNTATGANNASWSYTLASGALTNGSTYAVSVRATDAATNGNQSGTLSTSSFTYDTSAPSSATLTTNGNYNAAGWPGSVQGTVSDSGTGSHGISAVDVSIQDSVSGKCWNGTNFTTASCPNWVAVTSGNTATGANNASWSYTLASSALTDAHTYTVSVRATDATTNGNQSGTLAGGTFKYDTTGPTHVVSLNSAAGAFYSSGTLYYKGDAAGSFTVKDAITDTTSGPASVTYPAIATAGWTHNAETVNSGPNYTSSTYSWVANPGANPSGYSVSALDGAGNSSNASITFSSDTTAPSVTAPSVTAGYYNTLSVPVTKNGGTDTGGSGVDGTTSILERHEASLTGGSCGSFGATWTTITLIGGADTSVLSGKCYEYREKLTDNVGNQGTSGVSSIAKVDNNPPANALTLTSISGGAYKNANSVYYRGTAAGSFKIRNTVSDSESGPASSTTAALGGTTTGWTHTPSTVSTPAGGPYDSNTFSWNAGTSSSPTEVVTGADTAANTTAAPTLTFTDDSVAPSVTAPSVTAAYYTALSVPVALNGGSDSGSGVATGSSNVQRDEATLSNGSCNSFPGSWSNVTLTGGADTTVQNGKCYVYREQLTDNVGNVGSSSASSIAKVDSAAPTNSIVLSAVSGGAYKVATTVYYNGSGAGSFKLTNTLADTESGPASSATAALGGTTTGWTHTPSTVSTPAGGPYQSAAFSWSAGTSSSPTEVVTGADAAGNTTAASTLTFTNDTTAPSVTAPSVTAGYYTSLSVPVTKNGGSDTGGSGVDSSSSILERHEASLTNGACGSFGVTWTTITLVGGADTSVLSGKCYEYREKLSDNVGNQGTSGVSNIAKVDNAGPTNAISLSSVSGGAYKSATTVYYRGTTTGGGSFTLTNTLTDGESGPASSATAALGGTTTGWTHTPSTVSTPSGGPYESNTFFWTQGATSSPTEVVTGADAAGNTTPSASITFVNDSTAPSVTAPSVTAGYYTAASVPVTLNGGSDSGSGVLPGSSNVQRDEATLSGGSCNSFPGSWTNVTLTGGNDTTVQNGKCYIYREQLTDRVGNTGSSSGSNIVKVDLQGPTNSLSLSSVSPTNAALLVGSRVFYRGVAAGSFKITNAVSDAESGAASSATAALGGTTAGWTHTPSTVSTPAGGPYDSNTFSWSAATSSAPTEVVTAADGAGNTTTTSSLTFANDSNAPTGGALTVNGTAATGGAGSTSTSATGSFPIDVRTDYAETQSSSESGLASSTLTRQPASLTNGSCGTFGSASTISGNPSQTLTTGCYLFTLTGLDNVGNTISVSTTVQVDTSAPSAPTLTISNLTGNVTSSGTTVMFLPTGSGSFDITASSTDGDSGIAGYTFPTAASMGSGWSISGSGATRTYTFTPGSAQPGTKTVTATNGVGTTASDTFNVVYSDGTPPTSSIQCNGAACQTGYYTTAPVSVTLSADDGPGGSGVQVIRYTTDGSDPTAVNGSDYTSAINISTNTTVKFRAYDVAGNAEAVNSKTILVDGTAPTGPTLTVTENPSSAAQHVVGTTVFYRPGAGGTFRVSASTNDPETGVASVDFPSFANVTGGGTVTSSPYQSDYTWGASTSGSGSHSVIATNGAGGTASASFDLTADSTAPTGQTITLTGAGAPYYKTASVTFSLGDGNDGSGSGLDASSETVTRESATLSGDSCGTFTADGGTYTSPDTSVADGHCYRYTFTIKDNVGNVSTGVTATAKVDTSAPAVNVTAPTEVSGGGSQYYDAGTKTQYFRPAASGSFTLNATASDSATDVTNVAFPNVASTSGWSGSTGGADSTSPFASPNNYVWTAGATAPGSNNVTATDKAGNSATDAIAIAADSSAPTGQSITLAGSSAPYFTSASVTFTLGDGSDSESGIDTSSRVVTRETGDLSNGTCSNFSADAGTFTSPDTAVSNGHCYRYTFTIKDNVGNVSTGVTATAKVDTTAPTTPSLSFGSFTNAAATGTTVYIQPGQNGGFTVSSSSSDPESTVASTSFPALGSGWTNTGGAYSFDTTASAPSGNQNVTSRNGAGADSAGSPFTVVADTTAPQTTPLCNGGSCAGWFTSSPVTVTLSANDFGGSGAQVIRYTTDGSTPTLSNGSDYTGPISIASTTTLKFRAYDRVGNAEATQAQAVQVDTSAPSAPSLTLGESSPYEFVSASTLFYNPSGSNTGAFTVDGTSTDAESSIQKLTFPSLTGMTGGGDDFLSPYQGSYSWDNTATTAPGANNVVSTNNAGLTNQTAFTVTKDVTAPTGQSITLTGAGAPYYKTASLTFSLADGNDGSGSGVDGSSETVTRESASLSGDSCGTFTADAGTYTSPDTSVTNGHCYRYTFTIKDNVGNVSAAVTATAKVDTAAPVVNVTAPTELSGAADQYYNAGSKTQYLRSTGSGSFALNATASDGESAVTGVAFPDVTSTSGWSGSIGGTDASSPYSSPTNYTWTSGASAPSSQNVVATDKAGNTASDAITITDDTAAPTGQAITLTGANAPWYTSASVSFSLTDGTDGGAGIDTSSRTVTRETGTLTNGSCSGFSADAGTFTSPDTSVTSGHCYRYTFTIKDNVGNVSSPVTVTAKVDATSPSITVNAPTVNTGAANQHYDAPSTTLFFRPSGSGSFTLNATSSDTDSGISSVTFPDVSAVSGWTFSAPSDYTWSSGATAPGARSIVATNGAGLTASGTITIAADSAAPTGQTISLTGAGAPYYKNTSVTFTLGDGTDSGSGLDTSSRSVTRETAPLTGDSCGTFVADGGTFTSPDSSVTGGHCYRYTLTIADNVGNVSTAVTATAKVDTASPTATTSAPTELTGAGNQYYNAGTKTQYFRSTGSGSFRLNATASDTHTAVANVAFPDVSSTSGWSGSTGGADSTSPYSSPAAYSWTSGASEPGAQTLAATDLAGNTGADSITLKDDTTAPSGQTITAGATYFTSPSVSFSLNDGTDNVGGSGLDPTSRTVTRETAPLSGDSCGTFAADAGTFTSPDTSVSNGHCYRYTFTESDNVGNVSAGATATVKVDTANPTATLTNPGTPLHATVSLGATASDAETGVQQVVFQRSPAGAGSWTTIGTDTSSPFSQSWDTTGVTDGLYDLRAIATDGAGNTTTSAVVANREVDNTAPNTTIDAKPSDPSNNPTPTFQFSSTETGSTFQCRIDGGSWNSCSSPDTLGALSNASHTFDVRAADAVGNTDSTPATYTWTVDFVAPETTIDSQPSNPSGNASPTFTFSASMAGSTFACRIDGGSWNPCTSPDTIGPLAAGSHTFDVRATSTAGNTDPTPATYTWTIDLTAPSVTITAPTTYINAADPSNYAVTATTPDGDVTKIDFYECSNSSVACGTGTWNLLGTDTSAPYGALWTTPSSDGTKAIRAVATDTAGNAGGQIRTITIDRTAPTGVTISYPNGYATGAVTITTGNGPDGDVNAASGTIERALAFLTSDSCGTFGGYAPVTSPDSVPSGDCAKYEYHVADNAGNVTTVLGSNVVKRDAAAPTSSISDPGTNLRQTISLSASASDTGGSDVASVAFQRKPSVGGSWTTIGSDTTAPYSVSFDTTSVSDGLYDFRSVATDVAGNTEASPVAVTNKRIDNTAPSATMVTPGNPVRGTVTLTSTTSDGGSGIASVSYEIAPNGGSFSSQSATWNTALISDGLYDLRVVATDNAGNTTTSTLLTTRVDNTPPSVSFTSPASGASVSGTVALTASATDASPASPAVTFEYKLHSAPASAYAAASASWNTTTLPGGDGVYDLRATASDAAGNVTQVVNVSIVVDNVAPTVSITAPGTSINASVASPTTFSANANDTGSGVQQVEFFQCSDASVDCSTGTFSSLGVDTTAPYATSWNIAPDGNRTLKVTATDNAGHTTSATRNVSIDTTAPFTNITGAPGDPSNVSMITFTSSESGATFECRIDGGSWNPCTSPHTFTGLTDNQHTASVRSIDPAGNVDPTPPSWTWHRDATNPTGSLNNPGANVRGTVLLTSSETDPTSNGYASGVNAVAYQYSADGTTWATIGIANASPYDSMSWNTTGVTDGIYQLRIVIGDVAGNVGTAVLGSTVRVDNTPPTTSQDDPGQYLRGTKNLTGSAADAGSGVDHVDFQRSPAGANTWTTIGTDTTAPYATSFDTTSVADGQYDFRTVAVDVAGNSANATPVANRLVDNTPPNAVVGDPSTAGGYVRGTITLTSSGTSDPGGSNASGIASVAYQYSTDGGSTWNATGTSLNTTTLPDGSLKLRVTATDNAGNTATSPVVTDTIDNTRPVTTDNAPSGYQASPVTVNLSASDAGSGVNITEYSVDGGPYFAGTSVTIPAPADGSNDGAHTIAYFSADNVGNVEQVKSTTVLIDATPPTCPSCSAADYLRGTVTLSASPATGGSGIQSVEFQYSPSGANTWTTIGIDTTGPAPYTADWNTTAVSDGHYDLRIIVTDNANNATTTNLSDKVVDNTAPNVATVGAPTQGAIVSGNVGITASAGDVTSPIASVEFIIRGASVATDTTAPYSYTWDSTSAPDGTTTIQVIVTDEAGNTKASSIRTITVDNRAPAPSLDDPGANLHGTATLTAQSDPDTIQIDFERRPAGGSTWTTIANDSAAPFAASLDTTGLADGLYDFRVVATDSSGNTGTSAVRSNVRVDNTAPSGAMTSPSNGATVGGTSVALGASASDGGAGVASVSYERRPTGGSSWTSITTSSSSPWSGTWDTTGLTSGNYDLRAIVTDNAGNTFTTPTITVNVDTVAPTVVLADPGANLSGTATLSATVTGSGATQVAFFSSPAGANAWKAIATDTSDPYNVAFNTTSVDDGLYDLRAVVTDTHGNTSESVRTGIRIDNTAPRLVSSTPGDGSLVASANSIELVATEPSTASGVTLDGATAAAPVITGTHLLFNTGALSNGLHVLAGNLADASGKTAPFRVSFTVGTTSSGGAVERSTSSSAATSLTSADGVATLTVPAGAWSPRGNDWVVVRIDTRPATGIANGFSGASEILDVTAFWALSGEPVHAFNTPLQLFIRSTEAGVVPATFDGNWRVLRRISGSDLPSTWDDGFFRDATGYHLLTRHLTQFTLLKDVQPPAAPTNVLAFFTNGKLSLQWTPGADNSGTYDYVRVLRDGSGIGDYGVGATTADLGAWTPSDKRALTLRETDLAGNDSAETKVLQPVPPIVGLSRDAAAEALAAAGFKIGDVTEAGTGRPGTVTGPANLALAEQGAAINITIAPGSGGFTKFAFSVVSAKTVKSSKTRWIAARVSVTRRAAIKTILFSPRGVKLATWTLNVKAGSTVVRLRIPRQVRRLGTYTVRWTASSGPARITRTLRFRLTSRTTQGAPSVVVAGVPKPTGTKSPKVIVASSADRAFAIASEGSNGRQVLVVDVDLEGYGLGFVRDLHTVFPSLKIIVLSSDATTLARATRMGASIALPRSTPAKTLATVIARLLR